MGATTLGVKVDEALRARLRAAAERSGRTPHWLIKQGLLALLERIERGETLADPGPSDTPTPFLAFAHEVRPQSVLRAAITAAYRRPEEECVPLLLPAAALPQAAEARARALAMRLVEALRGQAARRRGRGADARVLAVEQRGRRADVPRRGAAAHSRPADARCPDSRQDRAAATGTRISGAAARCSSMPRPGG